MACSLDQSAEKMDQVNAFLRQHSIDWDRLIKLADRHRLIPLLYRTLQKAPDPPTSLLSALRHESMAIATDTMVKLQEHERIVAFVAGRPGDHA